VIRRLALWLWGWRCQTCNELRLGRSCQPCASNVVRLVALRKLAEAINDMRRDRGAN
jgi:hypothetical protein